MEKIIVGVDFSNNSIHALDYAINLANTVESEITMVWVDNTTSEESSLSLSREIRAEVKKQFEDLISKYGAKLKKGELTYKLRKGKVYIEIANQAKYDDATLVIAGSHGVSGFEEFWIGSNAYRIVTSSPCPVITLRHGYKFSKKISKIVLPIDSTLETRQKVPFTAKLASFSDAEIHLVSLYSTSVKAIQRKVDQYTDQAITFLNEQNVRCQKTVIEADNITNSTIKYAEEIGADLISIMTEQETTTANILLGPYAQQMVNNSSIPVLTIQARELMKIMTR